MRRKLAGNDLNVHAVRLGATAAGFGHANGGSRKPTRGTAFGGEVGRGHGRQLHGGQESPEGRKARQETAERPPCHSS